MYNPQNEEDDMVEMEEERLWMWEHVMSEVSGLWSSPDLEGSHPSQREKCTEGGLNFEFLITLP